MNVINEYCGQLYVDEVWNDDMSHIVYYCMYYYVVCTVLHSACEEEHEFTIYMIKTLGVTTPSIGHGNRLHLPSIQDDWFSEAG